MENFEKYAAIVAAAFTTNEHAAKQLEHAREGAFGELAQLIWDYLKEKTCATEQAIKAQALQACAVIESNFTGAQPGRYKSAKSTLLAYLVAGGTDMTLGKSAMSDFTNKVNKTGKYAPAKAETPAAETPAAETPAAETPAAETPAVGVVSQDTAALAMLNTAIEEMQKALAVPRTPKKLIECFDQVLAALGR